MNVTGRLHCQLSFGHGESLGQLGHVSLHIESVSESVHGSVSFAVIF